MGLPFCFSFGLRESKAVAGLQVGTHEEQFDPFIWSVVDTAASVDLSQRNIRKVRQVRGAGELIEAAADSAGEMAINTSESGVCQR